jgi:TRAP-type C4-dicarboxylate transport system permease small subunit
MRRAALISSRINKGLVIVSGVIILLMCVYTTGDVVGRYSLNHPLPAAFEITLILMIYITYWGFAYVQSRGGHMRLGFIWEKASLRGKAALDTLTEIIGLFLFVIIAWQGWLWAIDSWQIKEATMGVWEIPLFPARFGLATGASILCIQYVIDLVRHISELFSGSKAGA